MKSSFYSIVNKCGGLIALCAFLLAAGLLSPINLFADGGKAYKVLYVIDGDTIIVNFKGSREKVRLIGIDTPETPPDKPAEFCGTEATVFVRKALKDRRVILAFDAQRRDKYGRLLAYVYYDSARAGNDKKTQRMFLNRILLEKGLARAMPIKPDIKYASEFEAASRKARKGKLGVWGAGTCEKRKQQSVSRH